MAERKRAKKTRTAAQTASDSVKDRLAKEGFPVPIAVAPKTQHSAMVPYPADAPHLRNRAGSRSVGTELRPSPPRVRAYVTAAFLRAAIENDLTLLNAENRAFLVPRLLSNFADLTTHVKDVRHIKPIHRRVLLAAFGQDHFKKGRGGKPGDPIGQLSYPRRPRKG